MWGILVFRAVGMMTLIKKLATTYPLGTWSLQQYCPQGGEPYLNTQKLIINVFCKGALLLPPP